GVRQRLIDRRLTAIDDLAALDLASGRAAEVAAELASVVAEHPGREQLRGRLMIALFRSGRQAEALRLYHDYRHWLADGEGLDPGAELTAIAEAVLCDRLPPGDLDGGRSPAEVDHPGLAVVGDARPAVTTRASLYGRPNLLPPGIPDFVGRDAELDMIASALGRLPGPYAPAMVTVSGLGGVGKTTLVVHAARAVA